MQNHVKRRFVNVVLFFMIFTFISCSSNDQVTQPEPEETPVLAETNVPVKETPTPHKTPAPVENVENTETPETPETPPPQKEEENEYSVHNAEELLSAMGSDRTILLYPGNYDLAATGHYKENSGENMKDAPHYRVRYLGYIPSLQFYDLANVKIIGMPEKNKTMVDFTTEDMGATVLAFENCTNLEIANLNIGHVPAAGCEGDVLNISNSTNVNIENCILYGSGVKGLVAHNTRNVRVLETKITDCSEKLMDLNECHDFSFIGSEFSAKHVGMDYSDCSGITFENCFISNQPEKLLSFTSIDQMMNHIDTVQYPIDNGRIFFDWIEGYNALGPKYAKIEFKDSAIKKNEEIRLATDIGIFVRKDPNGVSEIGREYSGTSMDGIFWTENREDPHYKRKGYCTFSIVSQQNDATLASWDCVILKDALDIYFTLHENKMPAIVNPAGNAYVYEDVLLLQEYTLNTLLEKYGDDFAVKEYGYGNEYIYKTGLLIETRENGSVAAISFGNYSFYPEGIKKLTCNFTDHTGNETLIVYEANFSHYLAVADEKNLLLHNFRLPFDAIKNFSIYDLNGDTLAELYIQGDFRTEMYVYEKGGLKSFYGEEETGKYLELVKSEIIGNKLDISVDAGKLNVKGTSFLPDRVFYNTKHKKDKNELLWVNNSWKIIETDGKILFHNRYTVNLEIIRYYWGPPGEYTEPNEAMYNDLAVADVYLQYTDSGFVPVDLKIALKYGDEKAEEIKPMFFEEGLVNGPNLGMTMEQAYASLGGNAENFEYTDSLVFNDVALHEFCGEVVDIIVSTGQYSTVRGLKVGDPIKRVEELYGKPDLGFSGDERVEYKFCRWIQDEPRLDYYRTLAVYYENGVVSKFSLSQVILD